jgi:hypothetical protein
VNKVDYQDKHCITDQTDNGTLDDQGRDGRTNFTLRIKEQEIRLIPLYDDDDSFKVLLPAPYGYPMLSDARNRRVLRYQAVNCKQGIERSSTAGQMGKKTAHPSWKTGSLSSSSWNVTWNRKILLPGDCGVFFHSVGECLLALRGASFTTTVP